MSEHTPGPWRINKYGSIGGGAHGTEPIVASVEPFYGVDKRWGDHRANARLIAAASDLYAALDFIFDHIADKNRGPRDLYPAFGLNAFRAVEMARAALARARGETS